MHYSKKYRLERNVKVGKEDYDFIGISRHILTDVIFEVKSYLPILARKDYIIQQLLIKKDNYIESTGRDCKMILMTAVPSDKMDELKDKLQILELITPIDKVIIVEDEEI